MKRFLKVFSLLIISLLMLVSGVDVALDRLTHAPTENSFSYYDERGNLVLAYYGEVGPVLAKPHSLKRT